MLDELRRVALFSSGVAELTRNQAERMVKDLVKNGEVRRQQASSAVKELLATSKAARAELVRLVRSEIQNQIAGLGLVTARDLERLERRVSRLETAAKKKTTARSTAKPSSKASTARTSGARTSTPRSGDATNPPKRTST